METTLRGVRVGLQVRDSEGRSLGRVVDCWDEYFEARRGTLYEHVFLISMMDVARVRGNTVTLTRPAAEIANVLAGHVIRSKELPTRHEANNQLQRWLDEHSSAPRDYGHAM